MKSVPTGSRCTGIDCSRARSAGWFPKAIAGTTTHVEQQVAEVPRGECGGRGCASQALIVQRKGRQTATGCHRCRLRHPAIGARGWLIRPNDPLSSALLRFLAGGRGTGGDFRRRCEPLAVRGEHCSTCLPRPRAEISTQDACMHSLPLRGRTFLQVDPTAYSAAEAMRQVPTAPPVLLGDTRTLVSPL